MILFPDFPILYAQLMMRSVFTSKANKLKALLSASAVIKPIAYVFQEQIGKQLTKTKPTGVESEWPPASLPLHRR